MSKPAPTRYRTLNWSAYNASLRERGSLTVWFDPSTPWHAAPSGKRGGAAVYSDAAIQACLTIKVLFGLPLRQTTGFVASLLKLAGLDWPVPDFSTLCRRQKTLAVQLPYRGSGGPLHLLIDSTGHQGPGRRRMARAQAWRGQAARLAQGPPGHRRGDARGPGRRDHRQRRRRRADAARPAVADPRGRADRLGHRRRRL